MDIDQESELNMPTDKNCNDNPEEGGSVRLEYTLGGRNNASNRGYGGQRVQSHPYSLIRYSESRPIDRITKEFREEHKKKLARVISLSHRLIGHNPVNSFVNNYERIAADW